ncbi:hypothetical protein C5C95_03340 [Rathayibacter sp. AY1B7]|uniref:hypothetical protein n=1 Tax=Rathayibacter sp. AY1B7 TaxID=2080532 RepID=UPI000CE8F98D|nr:hypothetical protein [Rathayibacter sp. AY1B7]PPI01184.1 hypothetical protein C5C95_03340 [Rathayibacter sp. AY1B7]
MSTTEVADAIMLVVLIIAVVLIVRRLIRRPGGRYADPESITLASGPVLVFAAAMGLVGDTVASATGATIFGLAFGFGALCGVLSFGMFLPIRKVGLSFVATGVTIGIVVARLAMGWDTAIVLLVYLASLAVGLAVSFLLPSKRRPGVVALLGGVAMLDFALSPFGISAFVAATTPLSIMVGCASALIIGILVGTVPDIVVSLGGLAISILAVLFPLITSLDSSSLLIQPDWSQAVGAAGTLFGFALARAPFVFAARLARR